MVQIGQIDPDSLLTVSPAALAAAKPVAPPTDTVSSADLAAAVPAPHSDTVSVRDLAAAKPLGMDQQLDIEGRRYWNNTTGAYRVALPAEREAAIEPDVGLRVRHFGQQQNAMDYGVSAPGGASGAPLSDPEKQTLLQQLQRANGVYENENTQRALERGAGYGPDDLGGAAAADVRARTAQEEAAHEGLAPTAGSQFAHGMSNVMAATLVDPARIVTGLETPDQQRARLAADRALQQAQAQQFPITAGVARGLGQVAAPESVAAMGVLGPAAASLRAAASPIGRAALTLAEGGAYGGTVFPAQNAAAGEPVTPGTVARDAAIGAAGALTGSAAAHVAGGLLENAAPIVQGVGKFAAGGVASGAVNTGAAAAGAAAQGRDYSAGDAVRDFITGAALHVPGGVPDAFETMQAARDRIRAADPSNSILPRLDAEIARHATEESPDAIRSPAAQEPGPGGALEQSGQRPVAASAADEPRTPPAVGENVAPLVAGAGSAAEPVTHEPPASAEHLPPVPEGMTRFYTGGVPGEGPRWVTPDYQYARGYAEKNVNRGGNVVQYVDVPTAHPLVEDAVDMTGTNMVSPKLAFEAPPELMRDAKVVPPAPLAPAPPAAHTNLQESIHETAPAAVEETSQPGAVEPAAVPGGSGERSVPGPERRSGPDAGSVEGGSERPGGERAAETGSNIGDGGQSGGATQRRAAVDAIRRAVTLFRGVKVHDDGDDGRGGGVQLEMPEGTRVPWNLVDKVRQAALPAFLKSIRAAAGGAEFEHEGRTIRLPDDVAGWGALSPADRRAIKERFTVHGFYDSKKDAITTHLGVTPTAAAEEIFHAQSRRLREASPGLYDRMIRRHQTEDLAFREFYRDALQRKGLGADTAPKLRAQYFRRIRQGLAGEPYEFGAKTAAGSERRNAESLLLNAAQNDGVLMGDAEFEHFANNQGGLSPDALDGYQKIDPKTGREFPIRDSAGKMIIEPGQLSREGKALYPFVNEDGHGHATEGMDQARAGRYSDRVIREVLMSRQEKVEEAARHYRDRPDADPQLKKAADDILGETRPGEEDLPFATEKKSDDQLTLAGELRGRETIGGTGDLFGDQRAPRQAGAVRETGLPADAEKFGVSAADARRASAFAPADGEASAAFTYGVKQALEGKGVKAVTGMTPAEAREALAGNKAARAGMSPSQRQHAESPEPAAARGQDLLYATEKREEPEEGKIAPNVTRSAAILAAAKVLRASDHELFDAPPQTSEVPLRVSKEHLQAALDQVGKDWALDPAALEKYRGPVEAEARKLLARARRAGSFDAALASLQEPSRGGGGGGGGSVKETIRGSTQSADPEKIILSAKHAVRQAMRLREQGRSEGLQEAVKLRQQFIEEASKYLAPDERGPLMKDLASIGNEADLHARLEKLYAAFDRAQKRAALDDVRDLIRGADTKHMRPEFKSAMEALTGDLDDKKMSERTRARGESLASHITSLSAEERAELPPRAQTLLERMGKEPLDSFSVEELHDLGDSIRAVVAQNQLKNKLIVGKHLRDLDKAERQTVQEVTKARRPLGTVGDEGQKKLMGDKSLGGRLVEYTDSPEVMAISAGGEGGQLQQHTYEALRKADDDHLGRIRRYRGEIQSLLAKHGMTPEKLIAWRDQARRVELSPLPARPERRGKGGLDALDEAEQQAQQMGDYFDGAEGRKDAAARAAGESIESGGGPRLEQSARAARGVADETKGGVSGTEPAEGGNKSPARETDKAASETRSLELTGPEALSAWLYDQNPDAREKLLSNPVNVERFAGQSRENRTLQPGDLRAITATLTPFERELGEQILRQNREMGEQIGGVHLQLKGYELPREENYFPLLTDQKQKRRVLDELAGKYADKWLEQSGFLKERVSHKVPVLLSDALDTHLWHMRQASSFVSKAVPVRNARLLLGAPKVRETIDGHVGKTWTPRMEKMLKDFGGADLGPRTDFEQLATKLSRNLAAATLGLRPTSVATNYIGSALGMLTQMTPAEQKAFVRKFINLKASGVDAGKYFAENIGPHNAYLADRYDPHGAHRVAVTGGDDGSGVGIPTAKTAAGQKWRNFQEWSLSFISKAEQLSAVAAHRAITELNPEMSPADVADRVERMVRRTQPAVSSLDMSEFSRETKKNPAMGLAFMFSNAAAKARDVLRLAALKYQRSAKSASDRAALAGVGAAMFGSMVLGPAVVRSLWGQVRDGGQEQEASQVKSVGDHISEAVGSMADIAHPVFGGAWRALTQGSNDTLNNRALAQVVQGMQGFYKAATGDSKGEAGVPARVYRAIASLTRGAAAFGGVPLDAPLAAAEGAGKFLAGRSAEFHLQQEETQLKKAATTPQDKARLKHVTGVLERVAAVRKRQRDGQINNDDAESTIQSLLQAA